jgi:hypothetical protein
MVLSPISTINPPRIVSEIYRQYVSRKGDKEEQGEAQGLADVREGFIVSSQKGISTLFCILTFWPFVMRDDFEIDCSSLLRALLSKG